MNRRRFVVASTVLLLVITAAVAGVAYYSDFVAKAFMQGLPNAIRYFPADTQAVFGMNVPKFVASPVYAQILQQHEQEIGTSLAEFVAKTGVDPTKDIDYVIGAGRPAPQKSAGVVIAVGRFNQTTITNFIKSQCTPIELQYQGATVLMWPEADRLQKGIAFLSAAEIALGDLDSLHAVLDVRVGAPGIYTNPTLRDLLNGLNPDEMFWFAGDSTVLSNVPANAPMVPSLSAIKSVFGTLSLSNPITGRVTVTAKDETAAGQLADFARGIVALGNLAGAQNPDLAALAAGVHITQAGNQFNVSLNVPLDLLQKLEASRAHIIK